MFLLCLARTPEGLIKVGVLKMMVVALAEKSGLGSSRYLVEACAELIVAVAHGGDQGGKML